MAADGDSKKNEEVEADSVPNSLDEIFKPFEYTSTSLNNSNENRNIILNEISFDLNSSLSVRDISNEIKEKGYFISGQTIYIRDANGYEDEERNIHNRNLSTEELQAINKVVSENKDIINISGDFLAFNSDRYKDEVRNSDLADAIKRQVEENKKLYSINQLPYADKMRDAVYNLEAQISNVNNNNIYQLADLILEVNNNPKWSEVGHEYEYIKKLTLNNPDLSGTSEFSFKESLNNINSLKLNSDDANSAISPTLLTNALKGNTSLKKLNLSGSQINFDHVKAVSEALNSTNIKKLELGNVKLDVSAKDYLIDMLNKHPNLSIKAEGSLGVRLRFVAVQRDIGNFSQKIFNTQNQAYETQSITKRGDINEGISQRREPLESAQLDDQENYTIATMKRSDVNKLSDEHKDYTVATIKKSDADKLNAEPNIYNMETLKRSNVAKVNTIVSSSNLENKGSSPLPEEAKTEQAGSFKRKSSALDQYKTVRGGGSATADETKQNNLEQTSDRKISSR